MSDILFIVEGEKAEPMFIEKMCRYFRGDSVRIHSYCANIHRLTEALFGNGEELDEDIDVILHLRSKEKDPEKRKIFDNTFSDIFLVFDMDPQDPRTNADKLEKMLTFFNDPTDNGKLYLNYPMLESYKHLRSLDDPQFADRKVGISDIKGYKTAVHYESHPMLKDVTNYTKEIFEELSLMHLKKANRIVRGSFVLPSLKEFLALNGPEILKAQREIISKEYSLYVLNTCIFNIIDYRPSDFLKDGRT